MGSVTLWMQMSLDGFAEGPDQEIHWPMVDEELCESFLDELRAADLFIYGRKTYEIMASFWPTADGDPAISEFYVDFARCWKQTPKLVISRSLRSAGWNTRVVRDGMVDEICALRDQQDCNMVLFGGAETASAFMRHELIDEYRLFVHPLVLGGGVPLFPAPTAMADLQLVDVMTFDSAVVQMHYQQPAHPAICRSA
ncbi:dihydrofolate reductase family protein [Nocardia sp. NBC_00403]|uniref:dihydrofolate reductase family protein n=1 Tax=Nocardia sp. NBC_00403 TaxID=2975990 RepID=UPI002E22623D